MSGPAKREACSRCGRRLPPDAAGDGHCPQCLMELGLGAAGRDTGDTAPPAAEVASGRVGPYRLLERLGEGGMGIVYRAEQMEPLRREVALKILKPGLDTREILARFDAERQALARMDHPHVARVHDAGTTEAGLPFFVMELIRGVSITEYCDRRRLGIRRRLELFLDVLAGVEHAHQKGIIHRDLKPSNVLVSEEEGRPVPRVIDFGVAKATVERLTDRTLVTRAGQVLGTPEYMSPEQIDLGAEDVDTRADVYSLGVLLYELMVGARPFGRERLEGLAYGELRRVVCEEAPPTPSLRVTTLGERSTSVAADRGVEPATLVHAVRGDLDWIIMRALEKERQRRYASVSEFAADIRRHFDHEPVVAGPPSTLYRLEKFVRRHRMGVGVATLALAMPLVFVGTTTVQAHRLAAERDRANEQARVAGEVSRFLIEIFQAPDPTRAATAGTHPLTARQLLDLGVVKVDAELREQPEVRLRLKGAIGSTYSGLGHYEEARELLRTTVEEARAVLGEAHPVTLEAMLQLSYAQIMLGLFEEPLELSRGVVELYERTLGERHLETARAKVHLSRALFYQPQWNVLEEVAEIDREVIEVLRSELGPEHSETLSTTRRAAVGLILLGELEEGESLLTEVHEAQLRTLGEGHVEIAHTLRQLAFARARRGRLEEATDLRSRSFEILRENLGERHLLTLRAKIELAGNLDRRELDAEAARLLAEALEGMRATFGPDHLETLQTQLRLAGAYADVAELGGPGVRTEFEPKAVALSTDAVAAMERTLGPRHPKVVVSKWGLGNLLQQFGRYAEAEPYQLEALEGQLEIDPDGLPTAGYYVTPALGYIDTGRYAEAERFLREGLRICRAHDDDHGAAVAAQNLLRVAWKRTRDPEAAMKVWFEFGGALADERFIPGQDDRDLAEALESIAARLPATEAEHAGRLEALAMRIRDEAAAEG